MTGDPREVLTRPAPGPDFTVRYGEHPDQLADVRLPPVGGASAAEGGPAAGPGTPAPLVLFVHGGFWRAEYDRSHTGPLAADLAARGYPVVTIEYRRLGQDGGGWPGTFDDVAAALQAVPRLAAERAAELGRRLDPDRPVLAGHSAGGQLVLWYAGQHPGAARAVLALAPVADLTLGYRLGLGQDAVAELLGGGPDQRPERYAAVDPARQPPLAVPAVLVHGLLDDRVPVQVSRSYAGAVPAGGEVRLVELADADHFAVIDPLSAAWPAVLDALRTMSADRT